MSEADAGPPPKSELLPIQDTQAVGSPSLRRTNSNETERPLSAQRLQDDTDDPVHAKSEADEEEEESGPADRIEDFDWEDLHHRYHEAMKNCHGEEAALMQEWEGLMDVLCLFALDLVIANVCSSTSAYGHNRGTSTRPVEPTQGAHAYQTH